MHKMSLLSRGVKKGDRLSTQNSCIVIFYFCWENNFSRDGIGVLADILASRHSNPLGAIYLMVAQPP
ncbi:MAG: hypothetical protein P5683_11575 [Limnospira sp. PMC 1279.21]|uniref:hypothetical protein n=2 Tax=Sirenicapillariaceae TaxID=2934961 RepID=UPI0009081ED7|nr:MULTISPECIES: hypothetical protein [unclassified Limnospira]MDT9259532.1 hypothetical protein [Limnospira sp. PMC 1236.20]MDT9315892.1 hypothetical protein [Limnospira sp. PMC 1306.21]MDY7052939.1 hypothetical protein [Limnospira fusiformis LS22]MDT9205093.1 hypothetical protein [Limnospira sp. PMC 1243.20]MDT9224274.1 hypothetical protein [Limnospira sp. PMC 1279.21]